MSDAPLKKRIIDALWTVTDRHAWIESATLTGSFVNSDSLDGLSDIDFVVIVDQLTNARLELLREDYAAAVEPVLAAEGYNFQLNSTLGPLKFNAPKLAVLHLMLYSHEAHVEHVINSPFTCLDWQRSPVFRKQSMAEVYPAFGLQPRHFLSARRSIADYLKDFRGSVISYRELQGNDNGYTEIKQNKAMDNRDRHEFAYHVMRFLMLNLLKLVHRHDELCDELPVLMRRFFAIFPANQQDASSLLNELAARKRQLDYATKVESLDRRLEAFVAAFEKQFRYVFIETASRHLAFRHAATELNQKPVRFVGRCNPSIVDSDDEADWQSLRVRIQTFEPTRAFVSPLDRCQQSMAKVCPDNLEAVVDERLIEMNYGLCETRSVEECRSAFPDLFQSWHRAEDPRFPDGENSADVTNRAMVFCENQWLGSNQSSINCTHNVVLRSLVGEALGIPASERFRIQIPHLTPIEFIMTKDFGLFVNLDEATERLLFQSFATQ